MPFALSVAKFENCQSGHTKSPQSRFVWLTSMSTDVDCSKTLHVGSASWSDCQSIIAKLTNFKPRHGGSKKR